MSSLWHSTRSSLDDSVAVLRESLGKLKAAKSADMAQVIEQLKTAAESARRMRELVWSELPGASWQSRGELDALVDKIQKNLAAKALEEQLRSRLLALASELERGTIVHRRAYRIQELNQLRERAINELRSHAGLEGAPQTLPGPQADQWIGWACGLQEPQDAESLQALRNGFAHLDDLVANLEPNMWRAAESPSPEAPPEMKRPAGKARPERSRVETKRAAEAVVSPGPKHIELEPTKPSGRRDKPRFPGLVDELAPRALDSNTLTPNDATPPPTEEDTQKTLAQERALLAAMMGLVSDPVGHFDRPVELPFTGELYREASATSPGPVSDPVGPVGQSGEGQVTGEGLPQASAASVGVGQAPVSHFNGRVERPSKRKTVHETIIAPPGLVGDPVGYFDPPVERRFPQEVFREPSPASEIFFNIRLGLEERWREKKWMFLAIAALLVLATVGAILWGSNENDTGPIPVTAVATKPAELTPSNTPDKGPAQPALSTEPETSVSKTNAPAKEPSKPQDQSVAPKPPAKAPPAKPASGRENEVLRPPVAIPRDIASVKKEEAPPNVAAEMPASIPGVLPNGGSNSVANIVKNVPLAVPKIGAEKVGISSGVAQGLLIHQVTPQYPSQARQAHIQGTVVLQVVIGKDGTVQNLHVLSGHPMLNQAAMDAVRKWRYKPYRLNGEPVEADTQINVNFTLSGE